MLAERNPTAAYRRVEFDARVSASDPRQLLALCYEQLIAALGSALFADEKSDNRLKSESLTRAISAITALQLGVSENGGLADVLHQLYTAARQAILGNVLSFDPQKIAEIRQDFIDISTAIANS
ncbi:MAG: hypothetical protein RLY97_2302 [Pseudomonadota bacterium]|jgi:flagellar protein FliS